LAANFNISMFSPLVPILIASRVGLWVEMAAQENQRAYDELPREGVFIVYHGDLAKKPLPF
jgi:hypothetical protein